MAPKSQKAAEEGKASFFCKATGNPTPSLFWEKKGKRVSARKNRYSIYEAPNLTVLRVDPVRARRDDNVFTCVADNGLGEARAEATLHIYEKDESGNGKLDD